MKKLKIQLRQYGKSNTAPVYAHLLNGEDKKVCSSFAFNKDECIRSFLFQIYLYFNKLLNHNCNIESYHNYDENNDLLYLKDKIINKWNKKEDGNIDIELDLTISI